MKGQAALLGTKEPTAEKATVCGDQRKDAFYDVLIQLGEEIRKHGSNLSGLGGGLNEAEEPKDLIEPSILDRTFGDRFWFYGNSRDHGLKG